MSFQRSRMLTVHFSGIFKIFNMFLNNFHGKPIQVSYRLYVTKSDFSFYVDRLHGFILF